MRSAHLPSRPLRSLAIAAALLALAGPWPAQAQERRVLPGAFLRESGARYHEARAAGLTLPPATVAARMRSGSPPLLLDVRTASRAAAAPVAGARRIPLAELLRAGGDVGLTAATPVVVIADDATEAVEAMVFLRLAGTPALAMAGAAPELAAAAGTGASAGTATGAEPPSTSVPSGDLQPPADAPALAPAPTAAAPVAASPPAPAPPPWPLLAVLAALAAGLAGVVLHYRVRVPRRRRRVLDEALGILHRDETARFDEAARMLAGALTTGLAGGDVARARFALAYARARLGRYTEAASVLEDLLGAGGGGREALYLDLWLHVRLKEHDEATRRYEESARVLAGYLDADRLAGIAYLQRGRACLARRDVDLALAHFDRVRRLGVLRDQVPADLGQHQVVLGVQALYERESARARERFRAALAAAGEGAPPPLHAQLGLLLCDWQESECPDVDERLQALLARVEAEAPPPPDVGADDSSAAGDAARLTDPRRLLRNVRLWYAVSLLHRWRTLPAEQGLPADERARLRERLDAVRAADPELADPELIDGLIGWYFCGDDEAAHDAAVAALECALDLGVNVPEVRLIVAREERLREAARRSPETFIAMLRAYLGDPAIPLVLRRELHERMRGYSRFGGAGEGLEVPPEETAPSVSELYGRSELVHRRVAALLRDGRLEEAERTGIAGLLDAMRASAGEIRERARGLEETEQSLMAAMGDALLREEEPLAAAPAGAADGAVDSVVDAEVAA